MPISALERLRQLKAKGTSTSTPSGKSALERLRELKGIQAPVQAPQATITPPAYLQQPKQVAPMGSFGAVKQQENIFTQPLKQQDFNVPEQMRTPEAQAIQRPLTKTEEKIGGIVRAIPGVAQDVAKSFLDTGVKFAVEKGIPGIGPFAKQLLPETISSPADIAAKFAGKAGADPQKIQEAYDEMPEIAKKEISLKYSKDPKIFASQLINDALNVYSGGASSVFKGVSRPILRKLLTAAGVTLEGGAMSSAATFGQVLQEGGTVKEAASQGAEAFGPGAVVGGILSIPATVRTKAEKEADILAKVARKEEKIVAKQEKVINKAESLVDKASDVRSKRLNEFEESTGKPFSRVMVEQQLPIKKTKNGYFDGKEATQEALDRVKQFESVKKEAYQTRPEATFDVDEIANEVISKIDDRNSSLYEFNPETAQNMKDDILSYVDSYKKRTGTSKVNVEQLDELKKGAWQTGYDQLRPTKKKAARLFGNAAKDRIEGTFANTEFGNIIKKINKDEGELLSLIDAIDVKGGRGIHGKVIRGGVLGKSFTQLLGGYAGSAIPVPVIGPLTGAYTSGKLVDFLLNPQRLNEKAIKLLQKNNILPKYLKDINSAKKWLRSEQGKAYIKSILPTQKQLPAPKLGQAQFSEGAIPENPNAIITPYKQPTKIELPARKIGGQGQTPNAFAPTNRLLLPEGTTKGVDIPIAPTPPTMFEKKAKVIGGKGQEAAYGAIGGFEIQKDENGNPKVVFNREKAVASMLLMAGITRPEAKNILNKFTTKDFKSLFKEGVHRKIDEAIKVTQNLVNKNKATMDEYSELVEAKKLLDSGKISDKQVEDTAILMKLKGVDPTKSDKRVFTTKKLPSPKKVSLPVSKELQPLYEEAKKYRSAEEFVKSIESKVMLHGGPSELKGGKIKLGMGVRGDAGAVFFTPNTKTGELYANSYTLKGALGGGKSGKVYKALLNDKANIFEISNKNHIQKLLDNGVQKEIIDDMKNTARNSVVDWATGSQYFDEIQQAGFNGIKLSERPAGFNLFNKDGKIVKAPEDAISYAVFDESLYDMMPDKLGTAALKDIWNKANKN